MLEGGHQGERWSEAGGDLFMIIFVKMSYVLLINDVIMSI
jgi:hypothetical protein